ncbi:MAG TPA: CmcJ/NvfI family oxidoreductase [Acidimicrobiia bacterium]|nr:CmcJ/NvfI family oxidoreductase [Acidimicrobiia bacterium]
MTSVEAEINYIRNAPRDGDAVLEYVTEDESLNTMVTLPGQPMVITNGRGMDTDLEREGFQLVRFPSAVADFHQLQLDPAVDAQYVEETAAMLADFTGAARVIMLGGGKKRYGESAVDQLAPLKNAKPARYPHADNTAASAQELANLFDMFVDDFDLGAYARWAMYNVWRAITPPPQDFPLAVCDARSISPTDEVTVTAITAELTGDIVHDTMSYVHNPAHRWYYFPEMTIDEVIVFKSGDSDSSGAVRVPHTAFTDPTCPPGVPTRASVEMRALAVFD